MPALPPRSGIVGAAWVVLIPVPLQPLEELEVVLELAFHEALDRNDLPSRWGFQRYCVNIEYGNE